MEKEGRYKGAKKAWCTTKEGICRYCGIEASLSRHNSCRRCSEERLNRAVEEMKRGEGEIYERCRKGLRRSQKKKEKEKREKIKHIDQLSLRGKPYRTREINPPVRKELPEVPADKLSSLTEREEKELNIVEIDTGDIWVCPRCEKKFHLMHIDPKGRHRFREVKW